MASARASAIKWCMTCRSPPINHKQSPRKGVSESRVSQPFDDEFGNQDAPHWNCHRLLTSRMFTLLRPKPGMSSKQTSLHMMREACHVNIRLLLRGSRIWIHTDPDGSRWILLYGYWMILKKNCSFWIYIAVKTGQNRTLLFSWIPSLHAHLWGFPLVISQKRWMVELLGKIRSRNGWWQRVPLS